MTANEVRVPKHIHPTRRGLENHFFNAAKNCRGRMIPRLHQIPILTGSDTWYVTRIISLKWINPEVLIVTGSLAYERSNDDEGFPVEFRLDIGSRMVSGEITLKKGDKLTLSSRTREYYRNFYKDNKGTAKVKAPWEAPRYYYSL